MVRVNDRHLKYKEVVVSAVNLLGIPNKDFAKNPLSFIHKIVNEYNNEFRQNRVNKRTPIIFYYLLCYEYNSTLNSPVPAPSVHLDKSFFNDILSYILCNHQNPNCDSIEFLYDIIVLQLKLYCSVPEVSNLFKDFVNCQSSLKLNGTNIYYKIIECFIDALYLKGSINHQEMIDDCLIILEDLNHWFEKIKNDEWNLFVSIVWKITLTLNHRTSLDHFWVLILNYSKDNWENSLKLLDDLINDVLASPSVERISLNFKCCHSEILWELIIRGLMSPEEQHHKYGLNSMKKIIQFIDKYQVIPSQVTNIVPFICCPKYKAIPSFAQLMNFFFSIIESLDRKQVHEIIPALCRLKLLVKFHDCHLTCFNCFDFIWLECIFKRALFHKETAVVKLGVINLLRLDPRYYYEDLLITLINALNSPGIYDNDQQDLEPQVVKELSELFVRAEYAQVSLTNWFICHASQITWEFIPLFYITYSLCKSGHMVNYPNEFNRWAEQELDALKIIVAKNLGAQSTLKNIFLFNIIDIIYHHIPDAIPFDFLLKIYLELESSGMSAKLITSSLLEHVTADQAAGYVLDCCSKLTTNIKEKTPDSVDLKGFSKMTAHLFEAQLIFKTSVCPELNVLSSLFDSIIIDQAPEHIDRNSHTRMLDLFSCFLAEVKKICSEEKINFIFNKFISNLESVLVSVMNTFEEPVNYSYKEMQVYAESFHSAAALTSAKTEDYREYFSKVQKAVEIAISQFKSPGPVNIVLVFALHINYTCVEYLPITENSSFMMLKNLCVQIFRIPRSKITRDQLILISYCCGLIMKTIHQFVSHSVIASTINANEILISIIYLIKIKSIIDNETVRSFTMLVLVKLMELRRLMPSSVASVQSIVDTLWNYLWKIERNEKFFCHCGELFNVVFALSTYSNEVLYEIGRKYFYEMYERSKNIPRLRKFIMKKLLTVEKNRFLRFGSLITKSFICDEENSEEKRQNFQVEIFALKFCDPEKVNRSEMYVIYPARLVILFCFVSFQLSISHIKESTALLLSTFEEQCDKCNSKNISVKSKIRVLQLLLLVQHKLLESEASRINDLISESIFKQTNEPLVMMLEQWLLIRIYLMYPKLRKNLGDMFDKAEQQKSNCITSVLFIFYHVSQNICIRERQQIFIANVLAKLESFRSDNQFVDLFAKIVLQKLLKISSPNLANVYSALESSVNKSLLANKYYKQWAEDFRFKKFNPYTNYSLRTIFYDLPRLMDRPKEEWILPELLEYETVHSLPDPLIRMPVNNSHSLENITKSQMVQIPYERFDKQDDNCSNAIEVIEVECMET
ncbi:uncharacterized protein LOC103569443 [Microplitis demolitor]|uniref:uncharacterized protein LOC103569443 n=1 Tax=Microplitis demolitor TaxID=69319 RepID=UPI0004CD7B31|nr:uncharacterized protein LOC103569443 [Microplitis demolitor]